MAILDRRTSEITEPRASFELRHLASEGSSQVTQYSTASEYNHRSSNSSNENVAHDDRAAIFRPLPSPARSAVTNPTPLVNAMPAPISIIASHASIDEAAPDSQGSRVSSNGSFLNSAPEHLVGAETQGAPSYWDTVSMLAQFMPHLLKVNSAGGRHRHATAISYVDYYRDGRPSQVHHLDEIDSRTAYLNDVRELSSISDPNTGTRVILVEDLSADVIECLGTSFEIDPEAFAEHLNRSGYSGLDHDDDLPGTWRTHGVQKSYMTLKWYRVVRQNPRVSAWIKSLGSLLNLKTTKNEDASRTGPGSLNWEQYETRTRHQVVVRTNIFRPCWDMTGQPTWWHGEVTESEHEVSDWPSWEGKAVTAAWEEKATVFLYRLSSAPILVLLLDPLPCLTEETRKFARGQSNRTLVHMSLPLIPRLCSFLPKNKLNATSPQLGLFEHLVSSMFSTATAMQSISASGQYHSPDDFRTHPILALLEVVQIDCTAFFTSVETALDEIRHSSLDDYLLSKNLRGWRERLNNFEVQVPEVADNLSKFLDFLLQEGMEVSQEIKSIADQVKDASMRLQRRIAETDTALRADMQFSESRRSMVEAKTVTKLTELAFLFVPISFASSLFSMSIKELQHGVPIWAFIVTAVAMAISAYVLRILVASDFITDNSRRALERFWAKRGVRRGDAIPTLSLVSLTMKEVWSHGGHQLFYGCCTLIIISIIAIVPVVYLWTSTRLGSGFNATVTLFLLITYFGTAICMILLLGRASSGESIAQWFDRAGGQWNTSEEEPA